MWSLLSQLPRLMRTIRREHDWLQDFVNANAIDGIISDNRYGLWHPELPSVILTHQLQVKTGLGNFADNGARGLHYKFLGRFDACWVVDQQEAPGLAGSLSHPEKELTGSQYIGWLSQLTMTPQPAGDYVLVLLSGPEPQRTILSNLLWHQALDHPGKVIFVEGAPQIREAADVPGHITYYGRLGVAAIQPLLAGAAMVVCRSGYTSLMDLVLLNKKAILIPTPGQTEQEYLAESLREGGFFLSEQQEGFDLQKALHRANAFPYRSFAMQGLHEVFKPVLDKWLVGL